MAGDRPKYSPDCFKSVVKGNRQDETSADKLVK